MANAASTRLVLEQGSANVISRVPGCMDTSGTTGKEQTNHLGSATNAGRKVNSTESSRVHPAGREMSPAGSDQITLDMSLALSTVLLKTQD